MDNFTGLQCPKYIKVWYSDIAVVLWLYMNPLHLLLAVPLLDIRSLAIMAVDILYCEDFYKD